jgi:polyhydroxyalkanoate synthase subunit PhaC
MSGWAWSGVAAISTAILALLLAVVHARYWARRLGRRLHYDETHELTTEDGAPLTLRRLRGSVGVPVLLVHGIGMNHRNTDLDEERSLARYLRGAGRDVWLVTLRSGCRRLPRGVVVDFEHMARFDVPLAVETVLAATGLHAVDYVGFSMGGMLIYSALGTTVACERVRSVTTIGSPGHLNASRWFAPLARLPPNLAIPVRFLASSVAFASEWFVSPVHGLFANARNLAPGTTRSILVNALEDIPTRLGGQLVGWATGDGQLRMGERRGLEHVATLNVPAMFIVGVGDRVAPPRAVQPVYALWASATSARKEWVVLSRAQGAQADYGHGDLAFGRHAPQDVYARVEGFLAR